MRERESLNENTSQVQESGTHEKKSSRCCCCCCLCSRNIEQIIVKVITRKVVFPRLSFFSFSLSLTFSTDCVISFSFPLDLEICVIQFFEKANIYASEIYALCEIFSINLNSDWTSHTSHPTVIPISSMTISSFILLLLSAPESHPHT